MIMSVVGPFFYVPCVESGGEREKERAFLCFDGQFA